MLCQSAAGKKAPFILVINLQVDTLFLYSQYLKCFFSFQELPNQMLSVVLEICGSLFVKFVKKVVYEKIV